VAAINNDPLDPVPSSNTGARLRELSDEVIEVLVQRTPASQGSPITVTEIRRAGGAVARVNPQATAFGNREADFSLHLIGVTATPEMVVNLKDYTSQLKQVLAGSLTGGVYPNFLEGEEAVQRVRDG
jgi:hypothetical protein